MIRIKRQPCPSALEGVSSNANHYNKKEIVKALWDMQHMKCCYCECRIPQDGHLKAVEHFRPKSVYQELKNEWSNLLLACAQCNGKKRDKLPVM